MLKLDAPGAIGAWVFTKHKKALFIKNGKSILITSQSPFDASIVVLEKDTYTDGSPVLKTTRNIIVRITRKQGVSKEFDFIETTNAEIEDVLHTYEQHAKALITREISPDHYTSAVKGFPPQSGFNRHSQTSLMFPAIDTPGAYGLQELKRNTGLARQTWHNLVHLAADLTLTQTGRTALAQPDTDQPHVTNTLIAVAIIAASAAGWKNAWKEDEDNLPKKHIGTGDSIATNALLLGTFYATPPVLFRFRRDRFRWRCRSARSHRTLPQGTRNDCEDQICTAIATLKQVAAEPGKYAGGLPGVIASFIAKHFKQAHLVFGYAQADVATAKAPDVGLKMVYDKQHPPQGHAYGIVTLGSHTVILEATMPYLPHTDTSVYGGLIRSSQSPHNDDIFPVPPPIDIARYISVAARFSDTDAHWIAQSDTTIIGIPPLDYINDNYTPLQMAPPLESQFAQFIPHPDDIHLERVAREITAEFGYRRRGAQGITQVEFEQPKGSDSAFAAPYAVSKHIKQGPAKSYDFATCSVFVYFGFALAPSGRT